MSNEAVTHSLSRIPAQPALAGDAGAFSYVPATALPRLPDDLRLTDAPAPARTSVQIAPPGEPRRRLRRAAAFHDDPDGAGLFGGIGAAPADSGPVFTVDAVDVRLVGYRTLLTRDGGFLNDAALHPGRALDAWLDRLALPEPFPNEETGLVPTGQGQSFRLDRGRRTVERIDTPVILLASHEPSNYGSFLMRVLPKLIEHLTAPEPWRFMLWPNQLIYRQYLHLLGIPESRIVWHDPGKIYDIARAVAPGDRNPGGFLDSETTQFYRDFGAAFAADGAVPKGDFRRIYVSRLQHNQNAASGRVMRNEAELVARLRAIGFAIVEPQMLSALQQMRVFRAAELVVGPSGAGMFNTMFCRPGTRVIDIESEVHWIWCHSCMFSSLGLQYGIFEGRVTDPAQPGAHRPFTVNIDALLRRIAAFS